ncbi:MAG: hypothetical protein NVSMB42_17320 [Herpetosiphon sp.]
MATIRTSTKHYHPRGSATFELTPQHPLEYKLVDTYLMRLWVHDGLVYDAIQTVRNWQMRHFYVSEIARACRYVRELIGKEIVCSPSAGDAHTHEPSRLSLVHARLSTDWLTINLAATTIGPTRTKQQHELVHMHLSLQKTHTVVNESLRSSRDTWGEWNEMITATILCTPEECITFGTQLQDEISEVEQARIALGIPDYDDGT